MTDLERLKADRDAAGVAFTAARAALDAASEAELDATRDARVRYYAARDANKAYEAALAAQEQEQNND
jgi:hypothetical protein